MFLKLYKLGFHDALYERVNASLYHSCAAYRNGHNAAVGMWIRLGVNPIIWYMFR